MYTAILYCIVCRDFTPCKNGGVQGNRLNWCYRQFSSLCVSGEGGVFIPSDENFTLIVFAKERTAPSSGGLSVLAPSPPAVLQTWVCLDGPDAQAGGGGRNEMSSWETPSRPPFLYLWRELMEQRRLEQVRAGRAAKDAEEKLQTGWF